MAGKPAKTKKRLFAVLRIALMAVVAVVIGVNVYLWNARSLRGNARSL